MPYTYNSGHILAPIFYWRWGWNLFFYDIIFLFFRNIFFGYSVQPSSSPFITKSCSEWLPHSSSLVEDQLQFQYRIVLPVAFCKQFFSKLYLKYLDSATILTVVFTQTFSIVSLNNVGNTMRLWIGGSMRHLKVEGGV